MSAPNRRHSELRNSHIASFVFGSPVLVSCSPCAIGGVGHQPSSATEGSIAQANRPTTITRAPAPTSHQL